ncbi:hypothetical protein J7K44_02395 [bacterium]|nr:hypothetical protein [bacterium]
MKKGTISKIFDYYFTKPQFKKEIIRALREFFNKPNFKPGDKLEISERDIEMFNEWFIFDFKLTNEKTPLEDFYERNPYNLKPASLKVYKTLQDNHFGFYKVKEVRLGKWLTLENLQTRRVYKVKEFTATFYLEKGEIFSGRVGKVIDHYELVGANASLFPIGANVELEEIFRKEKIKLNPKILRDIFLKIALIQDFI